jgi:hypothetical protein
MATQGRDLSSIVCCWIVRSEWIRWTTVELDLGVPHRHRGVSQRHFSGVGVGGSDSPMCGSIVPIRNHPTSSTITSCSFPSAPAMLGRRQPRALGSHDGVWQPLRMTEGLSGNEMSRLSTMRWGARRMCCWCCMSGLGGCGPAVLVQRWPTLLPRSQSTVPLVAVAGITTPYVASPRDLLVSVGACITESEHLRDMWRRPALPLLLMGHKAQAKSLAKLLLGGRWLRSDVIHVPRGIVEERSSLACGSLWFSSLYLWLYLWLCYFSF